MLFDLPKEPDLLLQEVYLVFFYLPDYLLARSRLYIIMKKTMLGKTAYLPEINISLFVFLPVKHIRIYPANSRATCIMLALAFGIEDALSTGSVLERITHNIKPAKVVA